MTEASVAAGLSGLAGLFASGASPADVTETYLSRIAARNPGLGAFWHVLEDGARASARASARRWAERAPLSPIDGAPVAVKANVAVAGAPWHGGIGAYRDRVADADAAVVARLRRAGAVILGVTSMDEGAVGASGDNPWFGRCGNAAFPGWSVGGSSGGSAAAVAAGLCAAALGTDTLGSVRIPAAFCGCFGYKPARGALSLDGVMPLSPTLDAVGTLARSADDAFLLAEHAGAPPRDRAPAGLPETGEVPDIDLGRLRRRAFMVAEAEGAAAHPGFDVRDGFSSALRAALSFGASCSAAEIAAARVLMAHAEAALRAALAGRTLVLPTTLRGPHRAGEPPFPDVADLTALASVAGLPAIAVPDGVDADGRPRSVQRVALAAEDLMPATSR